MYGTWRQTTKRQSFLPASAGRLAIAPQPVARRPILALIAVACLGFLAPNTGAQTAPAASSATYPSRDLYGDPLPASASMRLGSTRLRPGWEVHDLCFSPDGKSLLAATYGGRIQRYDAATGQFLEEVHPLNPQRSLAEREHPDFIMDAAQGLQRTLRESVLNATFLTPDGATRVQISEDGVTLKNATGQILDTLKEVRNPPVMPPALLTAAGELVTYAPAEPPRGPKLVVREIPSLRPVRELPVPAGYLQDYAVSPDGQVLACGYSNQVVFGSPAHDSGNVIVYSFLSGRQLRTLPFDGVLCRIRFAPDSRCIAVGGYTRDANSIILVTGALEIWDFASGERVAQQKAHRGLIQSLAFSPDGNLLATGSNDNSMRDVNIRLWNAKTGAALNRGGDGHTGPITAVAFSPDSRTVLTASADHQIRFWDAATGRSMAAFDAHAGPVSRLEFFPDSLRFLTASLDRDQGDNTVAIWQFPETQPRQRIAFHLWLYDAAPLEGDRLLAARTQATSGKVVNQYWRLPAAPALPHRYQLLFVALGVIAVACLAVAIRRRLALPKRFALLGAAVFACLALALLLRAWRADGPYDKPAINAATPPPWGDDTIVAVANDGRCLLTRSLGDKLRLWTAPEHRMVREFPARTGLFSRDGTRLAINTTGSQVIIADGRTGEEIRRVLIDPSPMNAFPRSAFSPDGTWLATGGNSVEADHTVWLWDAVSGEFAARFPGHSGYITALAFSPDGRLLASGSADATVLLWPLPPHVSASRPRPNDPLRQNAP